MCGFVLDDLVWLVPVTCDRTGVLKEIKKNKQTKKH